MVGEVTLGRSATAIGVETASIFAFAVGITEVTGRALSGAGTADTDVVGTDRLFSAAVSVTETLDTGVGVQVANWSVGSCALKVIGTLVSGI